MTQAQNNALGSYGERLAAQHLVREGAVILDRNWHCRHGEIDIVAREGTSLVVCEVKTRRGTTFGSALEALDERKLRRLRQLAMCWLQTHHVCPEEVRVDAIAVQVPRRGPAHLDRVRGVA